MAPRRVLTTIDSHTAGHPTRLITSGLPPLRGGSVAEKYDWFQKNLDDVRTLLLHEPRGHSAMVGAVLTDSKVADHGAFFLGSYNYLPMCGHATIGIAASLNHMGLLLPDDQGQAAFDLEVPAGLVRVTANYEGGRLSAVSFDNVASYVAASAVALETLPGPGTCDIAYGGNWYALVEAQAAGVSLDPSGVHHALEIGARIKTEVNARIDTGAIPGANSHIHSVLFYQSNRDVDGFASRQLVVLAANKFDRSPCGTGTSARLAQLLGAGLIEPGEPIRAINILDVEFTASAVPLSTSGANPIRYRPTIEGLAHITGLHSFIRSDDDPIPNGFLCR